jgi:undecaprenyl-diphosphatase
MLAFIQRHPALLAAAAALLMLAGFGLLAEEVTEGDFQAFDRAAILALREAGNPADPLGPPWLEEAARDVTALGSFSVLGLLVAIIAGYLILAGRKRLGALIIASAAGAATLSTLLKIVFDLPRPEATGLTRVFTASFPSGHATASAAVFLTIGALLALRAGRRAERWFYGTVAIILVLMIGMSRVYLGVHYPTDVLAGWLIGTGWAIACVLVARAIRRD